MGTEDRWENIQVSEVLEGISAVLVAPLVLPLSAGMNQPLAKSMLKEAIAFSQRCQEAVAEARERFEDVVAEAQAELDEEAQAFPPRRVPQETSEVAGEILKAASELNAQVGRLTQGQLDLRLLVPLGLGTLALRQLLVRGLQLDELPWYVLAWYAFDSFTKLNNESRQPWESEL
ncbi:MAG: DUF5132 domain-containing protein [Cyanophyceae cyanobacterium]